ncbi:MAG: hypothetical protein PHH26_04250, partial [Candidatus Thermoplasmatota archaeon]|nr:hypothetical protein [Candidatus Thermoplasmatota archaeon]
MQITFTERWAFRIDERRMTDDGDKTVEFVDAKRGGIYVRHFGSKGKPHKRLTYFDYTFKELLEKPNA